MMTSFQRRYLVTTLTIDDCDYPSPSMVTLVNPVFDIRRLPVQADAIYVAPFQAETGATIHLSRLTALTLSDSTIRLTAEL